MALSTDTRVWKDCPYPQTTCTAGGTNGTALRKTVKSGPAPIPASKNHQPDARSRITSADYNIQVSAGVQHQIARGMSVSFNWLRRTEHNRPKTINRRSTR
jgi:hypothetical protein